MYLSQKDVSVNRKWTAFSTGHIQILPNLKLQELELNTTFSTAGEKQKIIKFLGKDAKADMGSS